MLGGGLIGNTTGSITGGTLEGSSGLGELIVITPLNLTISSVIANNGGATALTKAGPATLVLTGSNLYSGATTIGGGILQVGSGGAGASIGGTSGVLDNGGLVFSHSDAVTFVPPIAGYGNLTQTGTSLLTLLGNNTYSGSTTVTSGTLQVGNGGTGEFLASPAVSLGTTGAALIFNHADGLTYSGAITGAGSVTKTGSGVLTFLGGDSYTGNTTISAGTLQYGNNSLPATNISVFGNGGNIIDNAAMVGNWAGTLSFINPISGSGSLTQAGMGTLILQTSNSYTGATLISAGTLQVGQLNNATLGSGPVTDNSVLAFNVFNATTVANVISGTGNLTQMGPATVTVTASNGYSGGTTISSGTLQVSGSGTLGTGPVLDNGVFAFSLFNNPTYSANIVGSGGLVQAGSGVLTLMGSNTYGGPTTISTGTLQVGNGTTGEFLASSAVSLSSTGATLIFNHADGLTFGGNISGAGNVTQTGTGMLTLLGSGAYSGSTTISSGTLQLGNGLTAGNGIGPGAIVNNGLLLGNSPNTLTLSGPISGSGGLLQIGTGILVLAGSNTYSGPTLISAGTLQVGNGVSSGNIPALSSLTDNSWLAYNLPGSATYGGVISGTGGLTQLGGTLVLTASNSFTGGVTISGGTISLNNVNALVNDTVTVNSNNGLVLGLSGSVLSVGALSGSSNLNLTAGTLSAGGDGAGTTYSGLLTGPGGLTKTGSGILTFAGTDNLAGATTLAAGELSISATNNLPSSSGQLVFNGGALQVVGTTVTSLTGVNVNWTSFNGGLDIASPTNVFSVASASAARGA